MTHYFAYGSNMDRAAMRKRCPTARALGPAVLHGWRFMIMTSGYGSIAPRAGACVHGVLWRLAPRDLAALNAYEALDSGLYRRRMLTVLAERRRRRALVFVGRRHGEGRPRPGYMGLVVAAARGWNLPARYVRALARWSPSALPAARAPETGEIR